VATHRHDTRLGGVEVSVPAPNEPSEVQATHAWEVEQRILATARILRKAVSIDRALADVESLSRNDLRERYAPRGAGSTQTAVGSAPDDSTGYEATAEPARVRCPTCGSYVTEAQITRGAQ
jgi:hypothetical protein